MDFTLGPWEKQTWLHATICNNIEISDLPFISSNTKLHVCFKRVDISSSLTARWEFLKMTESSLIPCECTPIWNKTDILQKNNMINLPDWSRKGIKYLEYILEGGLYSI